MMQRSLLPCLVAIAVLWTCVASCPATAAGKPINFVFFLVDDLGYMDIGANNPDCFYDTPNVDRLARMPWPVLIRGETGVGKEHVARELHERGPRREGPFVPLNGGGLARELEAANGDM